MTLSAFFMTFVKFFIVSCPASAAPVLIALTPHYSVRERIRVAGVACAVSIGTLCVFVWTGNAIFNFFGVSLQAFKIAGGSYLVLVSLPLLIGHEEPAPQPQNDVFKSNKSAKGTGVGVTPLGIPIICGPAMISMTILMGENFTTLGSKFFYMIAIVLSLVMLYFILYLTAKYSDRLNALLIDIGQKITGLYLVALGVVVFLGGLHTFILRGAAI